MLLDKSIQELHAGLTKREFSSEDLVRECYLNIEKYQTKLNAFITLVDKEKALQEAKQKDRDFKPGVSKLYGLPYVLKDAYISEDMRTTAASHVLADFIPPYDSTVNKKLKKSGAILIGKMNMDAWGHGGSSENTDFGPVKNPWDTSRVAGGSSGGPAVAISTRMAVFAIGEDTGGSIRNPAAWCNITGLKVTYGRVSRYGTIAYASSFDTVGPMAKTAEDCAVVLEAIAGCDPYDSTSSPIPTEKYVDLLKKNTRNKIVIGVPSEFFGKGLDLEIKTAIESTHKTFASLGMNINEISMPLFDYGLPVYYLIGPSETSSNLARYDGIRFGNNREKFSQETMRRIMMGTYALSAGYYDAYYKKAQKVRTLFIREYEKALAECDVILMPVTPTPPSKIGELLTDPLSILLADIYTSTQNPVGVPSLALPAGFTKNKLPIGMQIVGPMFSESLLLTIGHLYQQKTDWHLRKPILVFNKD
ncbi:glutaminyl-tRNA synthase (glutamine-hydrolyzing) subunit A [Candidatus Roizmanbacteria bacterium RIFCSPHIGHO2_01_FULL_39_8]|uniref:Glutamyl-tRNA(Gln) amidotransferase subunit A n=3 Tax=Candidatus Roizmaniibacteriota TaxID=1752723 RepID=A0A1F7GFB1_9BACT|nr:MAG: glutaminyl-tRNA synthase (glutamine-hydrolyzing) subunit A [Candidatus Roizmanbacteria bacterium RIFCSPHIGHO2_01_FULL_39_8]OGK28221.1 MAG: glutaminyl-tRNA synthase (glutamine-hydrolyzing) subunit A [Candidatus Roizmanbacteria bacterium RIFCSPHIGHO2_02_FULL_39_9]OGK35761.1 MAG: glutaminyl-tRNA synthase (glutamine-hydrolyzing) subunit A [Candidatus Roizmanbacteria bacterium RIFCSPHIGHO2_12_FULL_39_8]